MQIIEAEVSLCRFILVTFVAKRLFNSVTMACGTDANRDNLVRVVIKNKLL